MGGVSHLRRQVALAEEGVPRQGRRRDRTQRVQRRRHRGAAGHHDVAGVGRPRGAGRAQRRGQVDAAAAAVGDLRAHPRGRRRSPAGWRRFSTSASAWIRRSPGFENIIIRGLFLGQTRKQMLAKVDEIAEFTELGDYLSMPLRTYSTGMRVRLAMGVVTSIDPEILLLDEGIGAVDADFLKKAQTRLQSLVERSGILVFASHSNEFLARLCKTAMWIDHGTIKMTGGIEDVVARLRGRGRAPATCARSSRRTPAGMTLARRARRRRAPSWSPTGAPTNSPSRWMRCTTQTRAPDHLSSSTTTTTLACATWSPANRSRPPIWGHAETSAAQAVSRWACCTRWRWAPTGCGWPTTTAGPQTPTCWATLLACAEKHSLAEVSPMVCDMDDPSRLAFPLRRGLVWRRRVSELRTEASAGPAAGYRVAVQRRAVPRVDAGGGRRARICGCSSAATRWNCTAGWCAPGCRSAPA